MNWSGGKDSALALYTAIQQGIPVDALVTAVNSTANHISMHGVRRELLEAQAASIGLPLHTVEMPEMPDMKTYEDALRQMNRGFVANGFTHAVFGDIFLEDLKTYREALLFEDGLACLFPLWKKDTGELIKQLIGRGFKAVIVCVNSAVLDKSFCGRLLDESFLADLPPGVDRCGENGEYHSFVFDGPLFPAPIAFKKGAIVFKEYEAPKSSANGDAEPQSRVGFYFQDLITA